MLFYCNVLWRVYTVVATNFPSGASVLMWRGIAENMKLGILPDEEICYVLICLIFFDIISLFDYPPISCLALLSSWNKKWSTMYSLNSKLLIGISKASSNFYCWNYALHKSNYIVKRKRYYYRKYDVIKK